MLTLRVPITEESFDEEKNEFIPPVFIVLELEHSLVSLSKWESKWEKPFLSNVEKTNEEILSYIECMVLTPDFPPEILSRMTEENFTQINQYMNAKMTATWFSDAVPTTKSREVITNELIYHWLSAFSIPYQPAETWHLNRLFTLIKVANAKNAKPQKMSKSEIFERNRRLNAQRKAEMNTSG